MMVRNYYSRGRLNRRSANKYAVYSAFGRSHFAVISRLTDTWDGTTCFSPIKINGSPPHLLVPGRYIGVFCVHV